MAEDLGHIKIDFGSMEGPEPTRESDGGGGGKFAAIGEIIGARFGAIGAIVGKIAGGLVDMIGKVLSKVIETVQRIYAFVTDVVTNIAERGRFSPEVMQENVSMRLQQLNEQMRESRILGPLYATIMRWYRELMRLLEPWKLLFGMIMSLIGGAIIAMLRGIMTLLNAALAAILQGVISILDALRSVLRFIQVSGYSAQSVISAFGPSMFPQLYGMSKFVNWLTGGSGTQSIGNTMGSIAGSAGNMVAQLQSILAGILQVAQNTGPGLSGADWAATQLREIAALSPLYGGTARPGYVTPGGQAPFFRPPGSKYP